MLSKKRIIPTLFVFLLVFSYFNSLQKTHIIKAQEWEVVERGVNFVRKRNLISGKYSWQSAPQWVLNESSEEYVPYIFKDYYDSGGFYQFQSGLIGVEIYDYYAKFFSPDMKEVRLYDERWEVQRWTGKKWADIGAQSGKPIFNISKEGNNVEISKSFTSWAGTLTIGYIFNEGRPLKHAVTFDSSITGTFRVVQTWAGIVGNKIKCHKDLVFEISESTIIPTYYFEFLKDDGSLSIFEDQWDMIEYLMPTEIDIHAQGLKANFIYSQWVLAQNESLEIDPDTATLNNPIEDGYLKRESSSQGGCPTGSLSRYDVANVIIFGGDATSTKSRARRGYVEWDISSIPDTAEIEDTIFKYHGFNTLAVDEEINPISNKPSEAADTTLWTDIASGTAYVNPFNHEKGVNKQVDLGSSADTDLENALVDNWFAIGLQSPSDECPALSGGTHVSYIYTEEYGGVTPPPTLYVVYILPNASPTITSASISDRDDGDNCYKMESYYSLIAVVNDGDGAIDIAKVYIQGRQGAAVRFEVRGTNLDGAPSYSIQTGATIIDIDAGSCSWVENGNEGTLTIKIRFEWDFTDEINLEIAVYVEDTSAASAGFTVMQTDYFDVLGRLVTSNLAVTDGRIDRNTATTFSGNVNYATTIGGNIPSVKYPPDAQWTAVHIHDSAHVSKGNDATIVNGAFSGISVTIPDAVQSNTYHVYLDLVPDYSDGDAPDGDTIAVIGDQIEIVSVAFPDSRININTASEVRYILRYDFGNEAFEGANGSIIGYTWDAGNSWWDKAVTSPANPGHDVYDENDLGALTDNEFGLTVYEDDAGSNLVGDRIKVLTLTANVTERLINEYIQLRLTAELEYDNHPLGAGDSVEINGTVFVWDAGDSRFEFDVTRAIAQILLYNTFTDGTEATYGITVGNIDGNNVTIVFYEGISILFGAGFNASSPFVELHWNHSLALTDFFEVQNSSDSSSWTYLGQNTTTEYIDLQVVNGTERYYRIRTCLFTDGQWYNGSFSDVNFEKVYFISARAAWLAGWDQRVKITIDHNDIDNALTDFPILIYISDSSGINNEDITFIFDEVGANSLKIAVTEDDGTTECFVEVEEWDFGNEQAWLHTKVPSVSDTTDTGIYFYYDNDHIDNTAYVGLTNSVVAENVWDADFLMVQHQAGVASPILDSTSNDIDMTETGDPTYQQPGSIDGEIDYDGNDYHLSAVDVFDAIFGADKGTMGLWIKTIASDATTRIVFSIEGAYVFTFKYGEGGLLKTFWSGTHTDSARTTTQINTGAQFYVVSTYDGTNQRVYVNGVLEATDACNLYNITALTRASGIAASWNGFNPIDANIDDGRVSKIDRSPAWIEASYETGRDDLLDWGSIECICLPSEPENFFWIFIAIALSIIVLLLSWLKHGDQ